jgi:glucose 1-dehydrogenase
MTSQDWLGLAGQVAVVTGGGSGIGEGIARGLAAAGAMIAILDKDAAAAERVATSLEQSGARAIAVGCDVTQEASITDAAREVEAKLGMCHVLVNNAGVLRPGSLSDVSLEHWNAVLAVNLTGYLCAARAFGRGMLAARRGSIVHIASISGSNPQPHSGAYSAAKAGVLQLSKQLAVEWGPSGVRSNAVCPGTIRTPMTAEFYKDKTFEAHRKAMIPTRRIGEPTDIANAVAFLASDRASYINGAELMVDGGLDCMIMALVPRPGFD